MAVTLYRNNNRGDDDIEMIGRSRRLADEESGGRGGPPLVLCGALIG